MIEEVQHHPDRHVAQLVDGVTVLLTQFGYSQHYNIVVKYLGFFSVLLVGSCTFRWSLRAQVHCSVKQYNMITTQVYWNFDWYTDCDLHFVDLFTTGHIFRADLKRLVAERENGLIGVPVPAYLHPDQTLFTGLAEPLIAWLDLWPRFLVLDMKCYMVCPWGPFHLCSRVNPFGFVTLNLSF